MLHFDVHRFWRPHAHIIYTSSSSHLLLQHLKKHLPFHPLTWRFYHQHSEHGLIDRTRIYGPNLEGPLLESHGSGAIRVAYDYAKHFYDAKYGSITIHAEGLYGIASCAGGGRLPPRGIPRAIFSAKRFFSASLASLSPYRLASLGLTG